MQSVAGVPESPSPSRYGPPEEGLNCGGSSSFLASGIGYNHFNQMFTRAFWIIALPQNKQKSRGKIKSKSKRLLRVNLYITATICVCTNTIYKLYTPWGQAVRPRFTQSVDYLFVTSLHHKYVYGGAWIMQVSFQIQIRSLNKHNGNVSCCLKWGEAHLSINGATLLHDRVEAGRLVGVLTSRGARRSGGSGLMSDGWLWDCCRQRRSQFYSAVHWTQRIRN